MINNNDGGISFSFELLPEETFNADFKTDLSKDTYIFEQASASDSWVIEHNLNKYPSVTLVDSAGTQFYAQVEYNSPNKCTIYMNGAASGKAYLN